jgi:hypothetical protein
MVKVFFYSETLPQVMQKLALGRSDAPQALHVA